MNFKLQKNIKTRMNYKQISLRNKINNLKRSSEEIEKKFQNNYVLNNLVCKNNADINKADIINKVDINKADKAKAGKEAKVLAFVCSAQSLSRIFDQHHIELVADFQNTIQIQVLGNNVSYGGNGLFGPCVFWRWHQAHMSFRKNLFLELGHGPQYRNLAVMFDAGSEVVLMALAGNTVQNDTPDPDTRVKLLASQHHGRHGPGGLGAVNTENYRKIQAFGQFGRTGVTVPVDTVVQTPVSFDNGQIRFPGITGKRI